MSKKPAKQPNRFFKIPVTAKLSGGDVSVNRCGCGYGPNLTV
jgi:hypothetical protein